MPVKSGLLLLVLAAGLAGCSSSSTAPPADATESAAVVQKNCNDPHWRDANLGLWYSVCRQSLNW
jgi:ABC-type glycerol-3-phosphate transport system substrate-binding protein